MIANQLMDFIIEGNYRNEKYMEGYACFFCDLYELPSH